MSEQDAVGQSADDPSSRYSFELAGGRRIHLYGLDQWWTYEGLLVGRPSEKLNRQMMDRIVVRFGKQDGVAPLLLEPLQTPVEIEPRWPGDDKVITLPGAVCVARFGSDKLVSADNEKALGSTLRVIWYQDEFAFPIDPVVQLELAAIDWEAHAADWLP